jgi:hypothetical protein
MKPFGEHEMEALSNPDRRYPPWMTAQRGDVKFEERLAKWRTEMTAVERANVRDFPVFRFGVSSQTQTLSGSLATV